MNFKQLIAKYVSGNISTSELPEMGVQGLLMELDSPSLIILAGLSKNENSFEILEYFNRALSELELTLPNKRNAALIYAEAILDEIINDKKEVYKGVLEIKTKAIDSYDFFSETKEFCYDSINFEKLYGLFDSYSDLIVADYEWQPNRTNEELKRDTLKEMEKEVRIWKENIKTVYNNL